MLGSFLPSFGRSSRPTLPGLRSRRRHEIKPVRAFCERCEGSASLLRPCPLPPSINSSSTPPTRSRASMEIRSRNPPLLPRLRPPPRRLRPRHRIFQSLRRSRRLRRTPTRKQNPPARKSLARIRLSRNQRHLQAPAPALARSRTARKPPPLLLPARSHQPHNCDLARAVQYG
jgi:hypothetical protein